jgi:ribose-phosphate pyrophosphokinase
MKNVVLLSDPNSRAWEFSEKIKDYINQEKKHNVPLEPIEISFFGNGETKMHVPKNIRGKDIYFIQDSTKKPNDWWVELLLINNLLHLGSAESVNLVLPDMKYSKQEKKKQSRVPISSAALARSLVKDSPRLKRLITMDLHAKGIQGLYTPVPIDDLSSTPTVVKYLKEKSGIPNLEEMVIVAADKGDFERAVNYSERLKSKYGVAMVYKIREIDGSREIKKGKSTLIGDVKGKRVFSPDDIIGSGETSCNVAKLVQEKGATEINFYGTHGWFTKGTSELLDSFERVMVSNTNNYQRDGIEMIDVSPVFAEAIYRAQKGESISELFK